MFLGGNKLTWFNKKPHLHGPPNTDIVWVYKASLTLLL